MKYGKLLVVLFVLILASCSSKSDATPTMAPDAIYTSAAQTVAVQLTETAIANPSATPTQTSTTAPTATLPKPTIVVSTTAPLAPATATVQVSEDKVEYVSNSPKDGTIMTAGQSFKVTWTVRNVGKNTWSTKYQIRFFSGDRMGASYSNSYSFPKQVLPGESVDITAEFVAPTNAGKYKSIWVLTNEDGFNFFPVYIEIGVGIAEETPTGTITATAATTP